MPSRTYINAVKVSKRLGTWVLYAVRDAKSIDGLIGYMTYTVDDLSTLGERTKNAKKRAQLKALVGAWRRAIRFVSTLDRERYAVIAERLIDRLSEHPEYRRIPYYVANTGHRTLTATDKAPLRAGCPRTPPQEGQAMADCSRCHGIGFIAA